MTDEQDKKRPTGDYDVGYCRTPVHTRFQKGMSGNPGGRPKKVEPAPRENREALLRRILNEKIAVGQNGKTVRMSREEAQLRALAQRAHTSDRAFKQLMDLIAEEPRANDPERRTGVLVAYHPDRSVEAWHARAHELRDPPSHPLMDELRKQMGRALTGDDEDET